MDGLWPSKPKEAVRYRSGAPIIAPIAQSGLEHNATNVSVGGSNPSGGSK